MDKQRGRFITVEGQDGAGKTTSLERIEQIVTAAGFTVRRTREPGGTALGDSLRELILHGGAEEIDPRAELLLIFAARAQHVSRVIEPALAAGTWVLCDRFTDATYAYQGGGRGLDAALIGQLASAVQGAVRPDLTLLLDVDIEVGAERRRRAGKPDRFERQAAAFRRRVRDAYLARARSEPGRFRVIDAGRSAAQVGRCIEAAVRQYIDSLGP